MAKRLAWFVPAFVLAVGMMAFVAACSGDGDTLSAEDYYKQLETLSNDVEQKLEDAQSEAPASEDPADQKEFLEKTIDSSIEIVEDAQSKLNDLKPPDDIKAKHDAFAAAVGAQVEQFKTVKETISNTEPEQLEAVLQGLDLSSASDAADAACGALQADADSRNITVDLKCG